MPETWVTSLGGEDPLEEIMATHSSILISLLSSMAGSYVVAYTYFIIIKSVAPGTWKKSCFKACIHKDTLV